MSEHTSRPDTDEVDRALATLVDDVDARSRPPGADRAFRSAGHRRAAVATTAVAAVTALVVGFGGWAVQSRSSDGAPVVGVPSSSSAASPAATSSDVYIPAPALMSLRSLNEASDGWVRWQDGARGALVASSCPATGASSPDPQAVTSQQYREVGKATAILQQLRFASVDDSNLAMRAAVETVLQCKAGTGSYFNDFSADLEVVGTSWKSGGRSGAVWLVNHGNRMDVFSVAGSSRPPEDEREAIAELVAADVQVP